ncbi:MAG: Hsp70 family protein, partial [Candidatus Hydrogenedens sp.]
RKEIEIRNNADSLLYSTEKLLKEYGDKVSGPEKAEVESALEELRKALAGDRIEEIESAINKVTSATHKLSEAMYRSATQAKGPSTEQTTQTSSDGGNSSSEGEGGQRVVDV